MLLEDTGVPLDVAQAEQIPPYRDAWRDAGWAREPRVAVTRSVLPLTTHQDWALFGRNVDEPDRASSIPGYAPIRTGRTYTGDPDGIAGLLAKDEALAEEDTILLTLPTQLGVDYAAHLLATLIDHVAPGAGWR